MKLEKEWLDFLHSLWRKVKAGEHQKTGYKEIGLKTFGAMLAREGGRKKDWSDASVSRFFTGEQTTDWLLSDLVTFFELPYPILPARSLDEIELFYLLRRLRDAGQDGEHHLQQLRANVLAKIDVLEKDRELSQELAVNPDDYES